jgi:hypothetical protein
MKNPGSKLEASAETMFPMHAGVFVGEEIAGLRSDYPLRREPVSGFLVYTPDPKIGMQYFQG